MQSLTASLWQSPSSVRSHCVRLDSWDALFANNPNLPTQLGYIVLLVDCQGNKAPLIFKSYNSRRISRFEITGEEITFVHISDADVTLTKNFSYLMNRRVPLQPLTDYNCLFDVTSKSLHTSKNRSMLNAAAAREHFCNRNVLEILYAARTIWPTASSSPCTKLRSKLSSGKEDAP